VDLFNISRSRFYGRVASLSGVAVGPNSFSYKVARSINAPLLVSEARPKTGHSLIQRSVQIDSLGSGNRVALGSWSFRTLSGCPDWRWVDRN
jgi:hypothetical protein